MPNKNYVTIDDIPVEIEGEKNLLELIRKINVEMPTLCYHSSLSTYGACRMCVIEHDNGKIEASCSTPPRGGMNIKTNTARLRKYRRMILKLLLSHHCRDCTSCKTNLDCFLQEFAMKFNITSVEFPNTAPEPDIDASAKSITRDKNKCILCGDCVRTCNEVQSVGAIDFAGRGSEMTISTAFDKPLGDSNCVGCGQCVVACPTGALVVKNDTQKIVDLIADPEIRVSVQIAPAVRVAIGASFNMPEGTDVTGKIVASLRRIGFDEVYDTSTGADLTVLEESSEFLNRISDGIKELPLFTSCCPAWVNFAENNYPELLPHISTCKSPMQMFGSILKDEEFAGKRKVAHVAVMPCTAKKFEASRDEFKTVDGDPTIDYVLSSVGLIRMIHEAGIDFKNIEPEAVNMPFELFSGAGVIFGVTGGVTEAVLRRVTTDKTQKGLNALAFTGVRGFEGVKDLTIPYGDLELKIAVVSGLANARALIDKILAKEVHYDLVEVMSCPSGCINGGGQPFIAKGDLQDRAKGLYNADKTKGLKRSEENPLMIQLYNGILKGKVHDLLHVNYVK